MTSFQLRDSAEMLQFRKNERAVAQLANLMNDPVLKEALSLVERLALPQILPETTPGLNPDTCVAHHHHLLIGVTAAIGKIKKLARPILAGDLEMEDPDRDEFEDHIPEELRPKIK